MQNINQNKTMKNILLLAIFLAIFTGIYFYLNPKVNFLYDDKNGIAFHKGTWQEAIQKAKDEHKPIFLDIYATWCGPCKRLKKNTFSNKDVGVYFNQHFINVTYDGEQSEGMNLMKEYGLNSFPSLLFIDFNGQIIVQTTGYHNSEELIAIGKEVAEK